MESRKIDDILTSVLRMSEDEIDRYYATEAPEVDPITELKKLAEKMTPADMASVQGRSLIGFLRQGVLFPNDPVITAAPEDRRVLLIGYDPSHLESRQHHFAAFGIQTMGISTAAEGLTQIETGRFHAVVVECRPKTTEEIHSCSLILRHLSQLPVISLVGDLVVGDRDALDRDVVRAVARLFGEHVPNRRPTKIGPQRADSGELFDRERDHYAKG